MAIYSNIITKDGKVHLTLGDSFMTHKALEKGKLSEAIDIFAFRGLNVRVETLPRAGAPLPGSLLVPVGLSLSGLRFAVGLSTDR